MRRWLVDKLTEAPHLKQKWASHLSTGTAGQLSTHRKLTGPRRLALRRSSARTKERIGQSHSVPTLPRQLRLRLT
jgi:hypothetical protein